MACYDVPIRVYDVSQFMDNRDIAFADLQQRVKLLELKEEARDTRELPCLCGRIPRSASPPVCWRCMKLSTLNAEITNLKREMGKT